MKGSEQSGVVCQGTPGVLESGAGILGVGGLPGTPGKPGLEARSYYYIFILIFW